MLFIDKIQYKRDEEQGEKIEGEEKERRVDLLRKRECGDCGSWVGFQSWFYFKSH